MLEHRHLRYFTAVAEEPNFSRAADRRHMAQPPLSVAIRKLERQVGTELQIRTTREVRLTDAGVTFLAGRLESLSNLGREFADMDHAMLPASDSLGITTRERGGRDLNELARDVALYPDDAALSPLLIGVWKQKVST